MKLTEEERLEKYRLLEEDLLDDNLNNKNIKFENSNKKINLKILIITFYSFSIIFALLGFYKLLVYNNPISYFNSRNAYVGGDAYNYMINVGYSTSYFILTLICVIMGNHLYNVYEKKKHN